MTKQIPTEARTASDIAVSAESSGSGKVEPAVGGCRRGCCPSPAEHYRSLRFLDHGQGSYHQRDQQLTKDRDAYRRLRNEGLQPKRVDGSHYVETMAKTPEQVEGRPYDHNQ